MKLNYEVEPKIYNAVKRMAAAMEPEKYHSDLNVVLSTIHSLIQNLNGKTLEERDEARCTMTLSGNQTAIVATLIVLGDDFLKEIAKEHLQQKEKGG